MDREWGATRDDRVAVLWAAHHVGLTRLALGMTGEIGAAEELVQDAFVALLARWSKLRDPTAALAYLRRVVVNGGRGRWRGLRRDRLIAERAASLVGAAQVMSARGPEIEVEARLELLEALGRLPARKRACVLLRHYADLSEAEVADLLGISVGTVKSQTARALVQLAQAIDPARVRR
jgi:RNA polymerase sigma-70 factor (sigma-E family)